MLSDYIIYDIGDSLISQGNFFPKAPLLQDLIGGQKHGKKPIPSTRVGGFPIAQPIVSRKMEGCDVSGYGVVEGPALKRSTGSQRSHYR